MRNTTKTKQDSARILFRWLTLELLDNGGLFTSFKVSTNKYSIVNNGRRVDVLFNIFHLN